MHRLKLWPGLPAERVVMVDAGRSLIGRDEKSTICIAHDSLSRRHAELTVAPNSVTITDLQSTNGTFVNGAQIKTVDLKAGDVVRCGEVTFIFDPPDQWWADVKKAYSKKKAESSVFEEKPTLYLRVPDGSPGLALSGMIDIRPSDRGALKLRLDDSADRTRTKLDMLLRIAQLLSTPEGTGRLQEMVIELAFQVFDIDSAALLLVNRETGQLEPKRTRMKIEPRADESQYSRSIAEYVRREKAGAVFTNAADDSRLAEAPSILRQSIQAAMCAPLKPGGEVIGVLYVDNRVTPNRFSQEDLAFIVAFANQVGIAIENADLYRRLEHEAIRHNNLRRFFPPATLHQIQDGNDTALETVDREVTALFCDISDFTVISGEMEPREVVKLLNDFFPAMSEVIFRYEGTLEKYIGDAMLAVWGAPFGRPDDADRAVEAAIDMQRALDRLNERWRREGRRTLAIHIGLSSGRVAAGNVGSESYLQYATIGEPTNIASRVCGYARSGEVVISTATRERLQRDHGEMFSLGAVPLKGKKQPVPLFRVAWQPEPGATTAQSDRATTDDLEVTQI